MNKITAIYRRLALLLALMGVSLAAFAQINTDQVVNIGRNAL